MNRITTALALAAFATLSACGGGANTPAQQAEENADNMSDALANQAENVSDMADNTSGAAADSLENQAAALENQSEMADEMNETNVVDEAQ